MQSSKATIRTIPIGLAVGAGVAYLFVSVYVTASAYTVSNLSRREIAGLWRLTPKKSFLPPVMEPVPNEQRQKQQQQQQQPKQNSVQRENNDPKGEALLMLNEDGSFVRYGQADAPPSGREERAEQSRRKSTNIGGNAQGSILAENGSSIMGVGLLKGTWCYKVESRQLILASDRPSDTDGRKVHDTLIMGEVTARTFDRMSDDGNDESLHFLSNDSADLSLQESSTAGGDETETRKDINLSVPDGKVSIGKYTYPKNHPSFFEEPMMFRPLKVGEVQLRQILGTLNTSTGRRQHNNGDDSHDDENKKKVGRYTKQDFYGRTFLLTTMPLEPKQQQQRSTNRSRRGYAEKKSDASKTRNEEDMDFWTQQTVDIRVMPIEFFANNTFCARGINKILRGRFGVTGDEKDQLWFQVSLFGSGRSVSGSVYSEGKGLTHDDKRSYLGDIQVEVRGSEAGGAFNNDASMNNDSARKERGVTKALFVEGSVVFGSDLGSDARPEPVARFTMIESTDESLQGEEKDDEEES